MKSKKRFVSLSKQNKKAQRSYHLKQRKTWVGLSPVERVTKDGHKYNRNKSKIEANKIIKEE